MRNEGLAAGTRPGRPSGLMIAIFLVPNRFYDKNGRTTGMLGHDWISVRGKSVA